MRRLLALLLLLALSGCNSTPSTPSPPEEPAPAPEDPKPALACDPCIHSPAEWGSPEDRPAPHEGSFWAPDRPERLPPLAYGVLEQHSRIQVEWSVNTFELDASLPDAPGELPVYMLGHYPASHRAALAHYVPDARVWEYHPAFAVLQYVGRDPFGGQAHVESKDDAAKRAAELLGPLLMPDSTASTVYERPDGWSVVFHRRAANLKVYADKPLTVFLSQAGQADRIVGRRRPILSESVYPLRSADEAWRLLQEGRGVLLYIINDRSAPPIGKAERFVVTRVELAYHEGHADYPRQLMQPYFLFWNERGQVLGIPAVADPHVKW